jgi:hypothetical protein
VRFSLDNSISSTMAYPFLLFLLVFLLLRIRANDLLMYLVGCCILFCTFGCCTLRFRLRYSVVRTIDCCTSQPFRLLHPGCFRASLRYGAFLNDNYWFILVDCCLNAAYCSISVDWCFFTPTGASYNKVCFRLGTGTALYTLRC